MRIPAPNRSIKVKSSSELFSKVASHLNTKEKSVKVAKNEFVSLFFSGNVSLMA